MSQAASTSLALIFSQARTEIYFDKDYKTLHDSSDFVLQPFIFCKISIYLKIGQQILWSLNVYMRLLFHSALKSSIFLFNWELLKTPNLDICWFWVFGTISVGLEFSKLWRWCVKCCNLYIILSFFHFIHACVVDIVTCFLWWLHLV